MCQQNRHKQSKSIVSYITFLSILNGVLSKLLPYSISNSVEIHFYLGLPNLPNCWGLETSHQKSWSCPCVSHYHCVYYHYPCCVSPLLLLCVTIYPLHMSPLLLCVTITAVVCHHYPLHMSPLLLLCVTITPLLTVAQSDVTAGCSSCETTSFTN